MNIPAMQNVTEIAPILRFRFGNATTTYGEMLTEDVPHDEAIDIDMAHIDEYYDLRGLRTFKTAYIGAVGGVFYDAKMNVLDYWGYDENRGGRHNCTPEGIVTAPDKTRYVRTNINPVLRIVISVPRTAATTGSSYSRASRSTRTASA